MTEIKKKMVSILLVAFNAEKFIEKTLASCLNQTHGNIEVLILDNASMDGTLVNIMKFSDPRIKIFEGKKNIGPYSGLNFLLEKAAGEYIAIQDHDDIWFPEKISEQVSFLDSHSDFIGCGTNVFYYFEDKNIFIEKKFNAIPKFVNHTSLIFRNNGFRYDSGLVFPEEYFEKKILANSGKIGCIQKTLTIHRIRLDKGNLSKSRFRLNNKIIRELISTNGLNWDTFLYVAYLIFNGIIPKKIAWVIRDNLTMKNWKKISENNFKEIYPGIKF
jgi:glycosyltransferase involved in cell wall biosynthesis